MSEVLLGTIIGGVIASIIPTITTIVEHNKWKKTQRIDNLRRKREILNQAYKQTIEGLKQGIIEDYFTIEMIADFEILFPKDVLNSFQEYIKEDKKNEYQKTLKYQDIIKSMKQSLSRIDKEIDSILS
jgi:branched-subunit amino acid permease